jgi:hypothetical protein
MGKNDFSHPSSHKKIQRLMAPWKECIHPRYKLLVSAGSHFHTIASKSPKTVSPICKAELSLLFLLIILPRESNKSRKLESLEMLRGYDMNGRSQT